LVLNSFFVPDTALDAGVLLSPTSVFVGVPEFLRMRFLQLLKANMFSFNMEY
jgi:hypothetical protein